jgi:hypothetical protein
MKLYVVKSRLKRAGVTYIVGQGVQLDDLEAAPLLQDGSVKVPGTQAEADAAQAATTAAMQKREGEAEARAKESRAIVAAAERKAKREAADAGADPAKKGVLGQLMDRIRR